MLRKTGILVGGALACLILVSTSGAAEKLQPPPAQEVGVPIYPDAIYIASFKEGPAVRYLFASNAVAADVVQFYEKETGKQAVLTREPDGTDSYRIVAKGDPDAALPELEIRINRARGAVAIPDDRGGTRPFSLTIFVSRRAPARK